MNHWQKNLKQLVLKRPEPSASVETRELLESGYLRGSFSLLFENILYTTLNLSLTTRIITVQINVSMKLIKHPKN